ncbi:MAG: hypothetical protein KGL12_08310 [Rhodospirillales bacterium]|nr:hypothetical protein [Rhodospirillales bacterium]
MAHAADEQGSDLCQLVHPLFAVFEEPVFRRADGDGAPVMVVRMGERDAAIPLRSLQREFGIADESDDGRMLGLIAESLDFVSGLRIGDKLPTEVLTGDASWQPDQVHIRIAETRLRLQLIDWLKMGAGVDRTALDAESLLQVADDPALRQQVQEAFGRAAAELGLPDKESVVRRTEALAAELAYIEALRDRLLRRVRAMAGKLETLVKSWRGDATHLETLTQVRRLTLIALDQIRRRFDELDAQTGEAISALRNADSQRAFIRSNRDWLYRSLRSWEAVLMEWDSAWLAQDETLFAMLGRAYHFLAPRFMPVTEWTLALREKRGKAEVKSRMVW